MASDQNTELNSLLFKRLAKHTKAVLAEDVFKKMKPVASSRLWLKNSFVTWELFDAITHAWELQSVKYEKRPDFWTALESHPLWARQELNQSAQWSFISRPLNGPCVIQQQKKKKLQKRRKEFQPTRPKKCKGNRANPVPLVVDRDKQVQRVVRTLTIANPEQRRLIEQFLQFERSGGDWQASMAARGRGTTTSSGSKVILQ